MINSMNRRAFFAALLAPFILLFVPRRRDSLKDLAYELRRQRQFIIEVVCAESYVSKCIGVQDTPIYDTVY